jgi:hypothetical protein
MILMSSEPELNQRPSGAERSYACEECGTISFESSEELRKHYREVHNLS